MKHIKLLLIAALISVAMVSCKDDVVVPDASWTGAGDAELFFGTSGELSAGELVIESKVRETSTAFTQIPITYVKQPYSFPFAIRVEVIEISGGFELEEVLHITSQELNFTKGPEVDENNNPIILTGTSFLEFQPVNRLDDDEDVVVKFQITGQPDGVALRTGGDIYTLTIEHVTN